MLFLFVSFLMVTILHTSLWKTFIDRKTNLLLWHMCHLKKNHITENKTVNFSLLLRAKRVLAVELHWGPLSVHRQTLQFHFLPRSVAVRSQDCSSSSPPMCMLPILLLQSVVSGLLMSVTFLNAPSFCTAACTVTHATEPLNDERIPMRLQFTFGFSAKKGF